MLSQVHRAHAPGAPVVGLTLYRSITFISDLVDQVPVQNPSAPPLKILFYSGNDDADVEHRGTELAIQVWRLLHATESLTPEIEYDLWRPSGVFEKTQYTVV